MPQWSAILANTLTTAFHESQACLALMWHWHWNSNQFIPQSPPLHLYLQQTLHLTLQMSLDQSWWRFLQGIDGMEQMKVILSGRIRPWTCWDCCQRH
jgi:hypothetical protein